MRPLVAGAPWVTFLVAIAAGPLVAQPQQQVAPIAASQTALDAAPKTVPATKGRRWPKADARVCLEFPTDVQVTACTGKYR